jgi:hypothetical protein
MTDDPIPTILASLSRLEQGQERLAAGQTKLEAGLSNLEADQKRAADGVGRLEARQDAILGTINEWMERLRDDQKAALGHARLSKTSTNYSTNYRSAFRTSRSGCGTTSTMPEERVADYRLTELLRALAHRPEGSFANRVVTVGEARAMAAVLLEYRATPQAA